MRTFASLLRSCVFLALSTGSLGQSVPASALEELRVEFHDMNEVLRNENAVFRVEMENKNEIFRNELENKNEALRHELDNKTEMFLVELADVKTKLEDVRAVFQTQPRRTNEDFSCMREDEDSGDIYFDGCNVHVRSGGGSTDATPNGKGNVIIGYNEPLGDVFDDVFDDYYYEELEVPESAEGLEDSELDVSDSRGGSHNLVIGDQHEYTSYGGIVTGQLNGISDKYSAVVGGFNNKATGEYSTVTGGESNDATRRGSSISGGRINTASGIGSSISGGELNTATGYISSISGGRENTASGDYSSVLGGWSNDAQGEKAVVTGGFKNKAIGDRATVVGGKQNKAWKKFLVVTGA